MSPSPDDAGDDELPDPSPSFSYDTFAGTFVHPEGTIVLYADGTYKATGGGNVMPGTYKLKLQGRTDGGGHSYATIFFRGDNGVTGKGTTLEGKWIQNRYGRFEREY